MSAEQTQASESTSVPDPNTSPFRSWEPAGIPYKRGSKEDLAIKRVIRETKVASKQGPTPTESGEAKAARMREFTLEIETVEGIADSDFLDRLAEIVYDIEELMGPALALNADGSIGASVTILAGSAPEAAQRGVALFVESVMQARPLRTLTTDGDEGGAAVARLSVAPVEAQAVRA